MKHGYHETHLWQAQDGAKAGNQSCSIGWRQLQPQLGGQLGGLLQKLAGVGQAYAVQAHPMMISSTSWTDVQS